VLVLSGEFEHIGSFEHLTPADFRELRAKSYGVLSEDGTPVVCCGYCGTTKGPIVLDHILPRSRGGTDALHNLALACVNCNERKGDRTPEEAQMPLLFQTSESLLRSARLAPYRFWTAKVLRQRLAELSMVVQVLADVTSLKALLSGPLADSLSLTLADTSLPLVVAKPISRPRKQAFKSRAYRAGEQRGDIASAGRSLRRRVRVNQGLLITPTPHGNQVIVVGVDEKLPVDAATTGRFITVGMLCVGQRVGRVVRGIVGAVQSRGRLTLLLVESASRERVAWRRVVVSPRQNLRVLSSEGVIFLRVKPTLPNAGNDHQNT